MPALHPYQLEGARWLANNARKQLLLADEMGLGKTPQSIAAADILAAENILIICPAIARLNWLEEMRRFSDFPRRINVLDSSESYPSCPATNICSFNYATTHLERLKRRPDRKWDVVIVDESHFATNPERDRTQAIYGSKGLIHHAERFWALTGTPIGNNWGELWVTLFTYGLTTLSYQGFILYFCETKNGMRGLQIVRGKHERAAELRELLAKIMLRRKKMDVLKELPPISFQNFYVEPCEIDFEVDPWLASYVFPVERKQDFFDQIAREKKVVEDVLAHTGTGVDGLATLAGLSDSVSTLRRYTGMQKVEAVAKLVTEELEMGLYEKVVIFAIHQSVIEGLRVKLRKFKPLTLYGGTPDEKRHFHIKKFQSNPKAQVFIANIRAAGTAVTLTAAHNVIFAEQEWVPRDNAQAAMRCHRIGQKNPVLVRFIALHNSLDQKIANVLRRKVKDAATILG